MIVWHVIISFLLGHNVKEFLADFSGADIKDILNNYRLERDEYPLEEGNFLFERKDQELDHFEIN